MQIVSTMVEKLFYNIWQFDFLLSALVFLSKNYFKGGPWWVNNSVVT